uniref:CSON007481 protein n=1 Tax=Culicoides sonorensis TaxID=179676 RepID=A0A336LA99_CULSO
LKCVDVIAAYIARIKAVNPILNAVIDERFNEALTEAKHVDELVQKLEGDALWNQFPLLGVPVSVKEPIGVKGLSHTAGDYHRSGVKASEDATVIKFLKEAGAIILCVTMEIFARLLIIFCRLIGFILTPFVKLSYKRHQNLPFIEDKEAVCYVNEENEEEKSENLLLISASDLVIDIKNGK